MTNWEIAGFVVATIAIGLFYFAACYARGPLQLQEKPEPRIWKGNLLVITRGPFGRASLSNLQLFLYTLIVLWLLIHHLIACGTLMGMSPSVLILLGISAAGAAGGQATDTMRHRLTPENWSWMMEKAWIQATLDTPRVPPRFTDLVQSGGKFDVTRFQALGFSLVVGLALLIVGFKDGLASFTIDTNILALIGLSQAVYVGGKATGSSPIAEIDTQVTKLRALERAFQVKALADPPAADLAAAKIKAPEEFAAYQNAARIAARLVQERTQATTTPSLEPGYP